MGLRVQWQLAAKVAAVVVGGIVAFHFIPAFLKPPPPEPLPADVGLPQVTARPLELKNRQPKRHLGRVVRGGGDRRRAESSEGSVGPTKGSRPIPRRRSQPKPSTPTPRQDPPADASVPVAPPPAPEAPDPVFGAPPPAPAPAPPDDGSMEFAPR